MKYSTEGLGPTFEADFAIAMQKGADALQGKARGPEEMDYAVAAAGLAVAAIVVAKELDHRPKEAYRIWVEGLREYAGYEAHPVENPENFIKGLLRLARSRIDPGLNPPNTHAETLHGLLCNGPHSGSVQIRGPYKSRYKNS